MPDSPIVCAVMLANGRAEMVARAVKSFRAQTYERKRLVIWDSTPLRPVSELSFRRPDNERLVEDVAGFSIGVLRNRAAEWATDHGNGYDIICHFDSDDWSHANRIAEQVALLQSSGAECVGYSEMLFWKDNIRRNKPLRSWRDDFTDEGQRGEAWIYRSQLPDYAIGTSMMYWRETWERHPFPDRSEGCDDLYWHTGGRVKIASIGSLQLKANPQSMEEFWEQPRMIASLHGGNTCAKIDAGQREWKRVPQWDEYCRREMAL